MADASKMEQEYRSGQEDRCHRQRADSVNSVIHHSQPNGPLLPERKRRSSAVVDSVLALPLHGQIPVRTGVRQLLLVGRVLTCCRAVGGSERPEPR